MFDKSFHIYKNHELKRISPHVCGSDDIPAMSTITEFLTNKSKIKMGKSLKKIRFTLPETNGPMGLSLVRDYERSVIYQVIDKKFYPMDNGLFDCEEIVLFPDRTYKLIDTQVITIDVSKYKYVWIYIPKGLINLYVHLGGQKYFVVRFYGIRDANEIVGTEFFVEGKLKRTDRLHDVPVSKKAKVDVESLFQENLSKNDRTRDEYLKNGSIVYESEPLPVATPHDKSRISIDQLICK